MRELTVSQNVTLDGVIDAAEGWFDPSGNEGVDHSDVIAAVAEAMAASDDCWSGASPSSSSAATGRARPTT